MGWRWLLCINPALCNNEKQPSHYSWEQRKQTVGEINLHHDPPPSPPPSIPTVWGLALATTDNTNEGFVAPECAVCILGVGRSRWWKVGWGGEKVYGLTGRYSFGGGFWRQGFSCFSKLRRNNPDIMTLWIQIHKHTLVPDSRSVNETKRQCWCWLNVSASTSSDFIWMKDYYHVEMSIIKPLLHCCVGKLIREVTSCLFLLSLLVQRGERENMKAEIQNVPIKNVWIN